MAIIGLENLLRETAKLKVLYVEDNEETRKFTLKMLKHFFSDITLASNGCEGLEKFNNNHFEIVFTDILMPNMDGLEMIKNIRAIDIDVSIVIFSAYDETPYFLESIKYGIDGYFLKPFDYAQVEEVLYKCVNKILEAKNSSDYKYLCDGFYWDESEGILCKNNETIALTKTELALFKLLSSKYKSIYSSSDIDTTIFEDSYGDTGRVRNLLSRLKRKLGCELIESIYGEGYRLKI